MASFSRAVLSCMNMLDRKGREWGGQEDGGIGGKKRTEMEETTEGGED